MFIKLVFIVILASSATSRHVPQYADLDAEDQLLFRAAYDSPSYGHEEYEAEGDLPLGKLDLLKDGMWAIKAKIKEMKIFNKALAANLLATKLQVKQLLAKHLQTLKTHHHIEVEKKPVYYYQNQPSPAHAYSQYEPPHYAPPATQHEPPQYGAPAHQYEPSHYAAPAPQHKPPQYSVPATQYEPSHYAAPAPQHDPPQYGAPAQQYEPSHYAATISQNEPPNYAAPSTQYEPSHYAPHAPQYEPPQYEAHQYGAPQQAYDPYHGL